MVGGERSPCRRERYRSARLAWLSIAAALFLFVPGPAYCEVRPTPPAVEARSHLLMDYYSGRVLAANNSDERVEPASLTKMMTAYVVFAELRKGNIALEDKVLVSEKAWRMRGSRMFIEVGKEVSVEQLLKGVIIQSGNDASVALAEHVAGDETAFASMMNQYVGRLGMQDSHFVNSSGLPDAEHYTSARDMAIMAQALIRDFPEYYGWHSIKSFEYNNILQRNRNKLLWQDESVDGLKTGYTKAAGYCLVVSAKRDDMRLVSVVTGSPSTAARTRDSAALLRFGFRAYETRRLYRSGEVVTTLRVWRGASKELSIGLGEDLYVTIPRGGHKRLDSTIEVEPRLFAPVEHGAVQGAVTIRVDEEQVAERSLIALHSVAAGNLWQRFSDSVRLFFQ